MVTSFYAGILGLLYFRISLNTIKARRSHKISLGSGPKEEISKEVSAHANFSSYAIYLLVLAYFLELQQTPTLIIHIACIAFSVGRFLHYKAFRNRMNFKLRVVGMHLTLWPLILLSSLNVVFYIRSLFPSL